MRRLSTTVVPFGMQKERRPLSSSSSFGLLRLHRFGPSSRSKDDDDDDDEDDDDDDSRGVAKADKKIDDFDDDDDS